MRSAPSPTACSSTADGEPVLILTSGAHRVDTAEVAERIGVGRLKRATPSSSARHTGQVIGGVSPIDHPAPVPTWIDPWLRQHEVVWAAAGHPAAVFSTTYDELVAMTGAPRSRSRGRTVMDALALTFSSGWASGINAYLVVLVLGIADRVGTSPTSPTCSARWDVLAVAGFLYAMEFIADKIPYIDSTWDAISTAIRPTAGAVIGVLLAGDADSLDQAVLGVVGGGTALLATWSRPAGGWPSTPPPSR